MTMNNLIPQNDADAVCTMTSMGVTAMRAIRMDTKMNKETE